MAELYHYGVPKDQWSDEARRRYDARHRGNGKTGPLSTLYTLMETAKNAQEERERAENSRRTARRWRTNKVDEQRYANATANRSRTVDNTRGSGFDTSGHRNSGQHVSQYRKPSSSSPSLRSNRKAPTRIDDGQHIGRQGKPSESTSSTLRDINRSRNQAPSGSGKPSSGVRNGGVTGKNASNRTRVKSPSESANSLAREYNYLSRRADRIDTHLRNGGRMSDYFHNGSVVKQNRYHDNSLYFIPEGPGEDAIRNKRGNRITRSSRPDDSRKAAENRRNRSTRPRNPGKTWHTSAPSDARAQRGDYGMSSSQFRDYVERQRRNAQNFTYGSGLRGQRFRDAVEADKRGGAARGLNARNYSSNVYRDNAATVRNAIRSNRNNLDDLQFNSDGTFRVRQTKKRKRR